MRILYVNYSDTGCGAAIAVKRLRDILSIINGIIWCLEQMNNKNETISNYVKIKFNTDKIIKPYLNFYLLKC